MIHDLSLVLKKILDDPGLPEPLKSAQIEFVRPTEPYNPGQSTLNLFLYDVRENAELRDNQPTFQRQGGQVSIRQPPMRVACSYLVTAWPAGATGEALALQEHQLLSQALQALARHPTVPASFLQGSLVGQEPPLPMMTAQMDGLKNPAEFWTAVGAKLRASFAVTVTIGMEVFPPEPPAAVVITEKVSLEQIGSPATREEFFRIGGRVTTAANAPVVGAIVTLVQRGLSTTTDADGRYTLGPVPSSPSYTLRVQKDAAMKEVSIAIPVPAGSNYNVQLP